MQPIKSIPCALIQSENNGWNTFLDSLYSVPVFNSKQMYLSKLFIALSPWCSAWVGTLENKNKNGIVGMNEKIQYWIDING